MATDRKATTRWAGELGTGSGTITFDTSNAAKFSVTFPTRSGDANGQTSPEELIAAAHSSCFSMQLSGLLGASGYTPESIDTSAEVTLDQKDGGYAITGISLRVRAAVPGADDETLQQAAQQAKETCPVSAALAGTSITMEATLA